MAKKTKPVDFGSFNFGANAAQAVKAGKGKGKKRKSTGKREWTGSRTGITATFGS